MNEITDISVQIKRLHILLKEVEERKQDIRAEVLVNQAVGKDIDIENIITVNNSFFQREFSRDISKVRLEVDEWHRNLLILELARPGFYDMLPEGLFFQPQPSEYRAGSLDATEMAAKYRRDKAKENEVRTFFQPFENEFFVHQLFIERQEELLTAYFQKPIPEIWNLPEKLPESAVTSLLLLIPYAHQIAGNVLLMQKCLTLLLNEPVAIKVKTIIDNNLDGEDKPSGAWELGNNFVCGSSFKEPFIMLNYVVGPLRREKLGSFLPGGTQQLAIETFNLYFVPADMDVEITLELDKKQKSVLDTKQELVLGYSTIL